MNNSYVRGRIGITPIVDKVRKNRLKWLEHVMRRKKLKAVRTAIEMNVEEKRSWLQFK